jgi:hypothetical protein
MTLISMTIVRNLKAIVLAMVMKQKRIYYSGKKVKQRRFQKRDTRCRIPNENCEKVGLEQNILAVF